MEFNDDLFEKIIVEGNTDATDVKAHNKTIYDDIEVQEEVILQNKDLYEIFFKINKVLEGKADYNCIQTTSPAVNVNSGVLTIGGQTKNGDEKDERAVLSFISDMEAVSPGMKFDSQVDFIDDEDRSNGRFKFVITISRK